MSLITYARRPVVTLTIEGGVGPLGNNQTRVSALRIVLLVNLGDTVIRLRGPAAGHGRHDHPVLKLEVAHRQG